jgi:putative protease
VQLDRAEDLYIVQSEKPVKVILEYNSSTAKAIKAREALPFARNDIIIAFNPFFPQGSEESLAADTETLVNLGFKYFMLNNPGHLSLFRQVPESKRLLIAGPWLYSFNRWSYRFLREQGFEYSVSPLENNRQNLERTIDPERRGFCFLTLFAYPALFRIRSNLKALYGFKHFSDKEGGEFKLETGRDGSKVRPTSPFSIVDKRPFLEKAGFRHFILNLSGGGFKKQDYKDLLAALRMAKPLEGISRFNWKDGFYHSKEN